MKDIAEEHFSAFIRYRKSFAAYKRIKTAARDWPMEVLVFYGPTGTGKSHTCRTRWPDAYWLDAPKGSGTYWDSYAGEETVVIDEFYGAHFSWGFLLRLCDKYPLTVPIHGDAGHQFTSRRIVFTSNQHPRDWYRKMHEKAGTDWAPLRRRITRIEHLAIRYNPGADAEEEPPEPSYEGDEQPYIWLPEIGEN